MKDIITSLWNALAILAIGFTAWTGYTTWQGPKDRTEVGPIIIEAVRHVNKQVFVEHYTSVEIRDIDVPEGWWSWLKNVGVHQEFLMLIRGNVPAGIDLSQLDEADIWVSPDGKRAQVTLPPPQVFTENVALDLENSRLLENSDYCPGFICPDDRLTRFKDRLAPEAEARLIAAAEEKGILRQAAADAEVYYEDLLNALGIAEVRVVIPGYTAGQ